MGRTENVNVNVNGASERSNFNVKDNVSRSRRSAQIKRNQRIAAELTRKFGSIAEGSFAYLCGVADKLSEAKIWDLYERSQHWKVRNSWAWFLAMTKRELDAAI